MDLLSARNSKGVLFLGKCGGLKETTEIGHYNEISRGALLLVSDVPTTPDGVKTEASDKCVTSNWADKSELRP